MHIRAELLLAAHRELGNNAETPKIYYPGCGADRTLAEVGDVTYVDVSYTKVPGINIVHADANTYTPEGEFDVIAFFDSAGDIDPNEVIKRTVLTAGGIAVWRSYNYQRPQLQQNTFISTTNLLGIAEINERSESIVTTEKLDSYFELLGFDELEPGMQNEVSEALKASGKEIPADPELLYDAMGSINLIPQYRYQRRWQLFVFGLRG